MRKFFFLPFLFIFISSLAFAAPFKGSQIGISAACPYAVDAGKRIAEMGGNPVDVAVTVALVMSVTNPAFASLGGGGFALVKMTGAPEVLDFRERAPGLTHEKFYLDGKKSSSYGGSAVGVPGIPAGLWALHKKYGKIHWSQLFTTAISLANKGFRVTGGWYEDTLDGMERFDQTAQKTFLVNEKPIRPGRMLVQKNLAKALSLLRNRNTAGFYSGPVAEDIVKTVKARGGVMSLKDLTDYKVEWRKPLMKEYEGHKVYLMPPPSSGGVVIYSELSLIEKLKVREKKPLSVDEFHYLAEISKNSFRQRLLLGDPDFVKNPLDKLMSDAFLSEQAKLIKSDKVTKLEPFAESDFGLGQAKESAQTTHISVLDAKGQGVAMTITLNLNYGSGVVTDQYGIAMNNEMDDFTTQPGVANQFGLVQGSANQVQPGKRPLSSMSPTLVEKDGKIVMALGAPGGPRIITSVVNMLYRTLTTKVDLDRAIQMPRVHHQFLPDKTFVDSDHRFAPETLEGLTKKGHNIEESWMGLGYAVQFKDGLISAAYDSRADGAAGGF
jgi:gamma-glutamyltranspeptidase / glutathione hydrolase